MNTLIKEIDQLPFSEAYKLYNYLEQRFNLNNTSTLDQETIDILDAREVDFQNGDYEDWEVARKELGI